MNSFDFIWMLLTEFTFREKGPESVQPTIQYRTLAMKILLILYDIV